ncbi:mitochondrial respiratory chain complex I assembly [Homalodisca vitripennis]|nr:mitochondrial respiratory chain complex I assembly [Homalodisca vitripennis]
MANRIHDQYIPAIRLVGCIAEQISTEHLDKKDKQLDEYLKKVYVSTPDPAPKVGLGVIDTLVSHSLCGQVGLGVIHILVSHILYGQVGGWGWEVSHTRFPHLYGLVGWEASQTLSFPHSVWPGEVGWGANHTVVSHILCGQVGLGVIDTLVSHILCGQVGLGVIDILVSHILYGQVGGVACQTLVSHIMYGQWGWEASQTLVSHILCGQVGWGVSHTLLSHNLYLVVSRSERPVNPERPLPLSRHTDEEVTYGYSESEEQHIPPGRVSLKQALQFISDSQSDPDKHTSTAIAAQYKLDINTTNDILEHFKMFNVHIQKKEKDPALMSKYEQLQLKIKHMSMYNAPEVFKEMNLLKKKTDESGIEIKEIKDADSDVDTKKETSSSLSSEESKTNR